MILRKITSAIVLCICVCLLSGRPCFSLSAASFGRARLSQRVVKGATPLARRRDERGSEGIITISGSKSCGRSNGIGALDAATRAASNDVPEGLPSSAASSSFLQVADKLTTMFPFWVTSAALLGLLKPASLAWFAASNNAVTASLGAVMFATGLTVTVEDFTRVKGKPRAVLLGLFCQWTFMPTLAYCTAKAFGLSKAFFLGLALVGCSPGGTASNLVTYIAGADVALSVFLTTCSTCLAAFLTPLLTKVVCGQVVAVNALALAESTAKVVLAPVALGVYVNYNFPRFSAFLSKFAPLSSVAIVSLICGSVVASNHQIARACGPRLIGAVAVMHSLGFAIGYAFPRIFGQSKKTARTISIETGMQNSALAVVLATTLPYTGCKLPPAISATIHSCIGSAAAALWRLQDERSKRQE